MLVAVSDGVGVDVEFGVGLGVSVGVGVTHSKVTTIPLIMSFLEAPE